MGRTLKTLMGVFSFTSAITLPAHMGRTKVTSAPLPPKRITSVAMAAFKRAATRGNKSFPKAVDAPEKDVRSATKELLDTQRKDGGWSQLDTMDSDAYATGLTLVALHEVGQLKISDPVYQRGVEFLLKTQLPDGSWFVKSRSRPFQTYYESGFPHEKNQFISMAASGWAATALALTLPTNPGSKQP